MNTPHFTTNGFWGLRTRYILAFLALLCAAVGLTFAQGAGISAGGKWTQLETEDKMTGAKKVRFELPADNPLEAGAVPQVSVFCVGGKWKLSDFRPNLKVARPNRISFSGRPQMRVMVRVDGSHSNHNWNWVNGDFLAMDEDTTRQMMGANIFKIQFESDRGPMIAEFSPAGLNLASVRNACGLKPAKP